MEGQGELAMAELLLLTMVVGVIPIRKERSQGLQNSV
jgi:hypothetical protein